MATLTSNNGEAKLKFEFYKFEFENTSDENDREWIVGDLVFENSQFSAKVENDPQFTLSYLNTFIKELLDLIDSKAQSIRYHGIEPYLDMTIEDKTNGLFEVNGIFRSLNTGRNELKFSFETDQTYIRQFVSETIAELEPFNKLRPLN
jgi:hypothetical protein